MGFLKNYELVCEIKITLQLCYRDRKYFLKKTQNTSQNTKIQKNL